MAGSYNHVVTKAGNLRSNESFVQMVENLGDAYETVEEMYGMIWHLAQQIAPADGDVDARDVVEDARRDYEQGLDFARVANAQ